MDNFQVYRGANEPTAYFLCAGKELDKFPKKKMRNYSMEF